MTAPKLFDVRANDIPNEGIPVVRYWRRVVLDPDCAGAWLVAGDVDGDGQVELVSARNAGNTPDDERARYGCYVVSVVAQRLDGSVLWRWGPPGVGRNYVGYDVACHIHDWDGDGCNEVILATKATLVVLDGATGREKRRFAIPDDAVDCIAFANLSGGPRPTELILKNRYEQVWAFDREGRLLWTARQPGGHLIAHQARPMDIDGDGRDEIMAGHALLNPDGSVRWALGEWADLPGHLDCARVVHLDSAPEDSRLCLSLCGGNLLAMVDGNGRLVWSIAGYHFESVDVGKVCADVPGKQIVVDIDHSPWGQRPLWVIDADGALLGQIVTNNSRFHLLIDWAGTGTDSIVIAEDRCLFDGRGHKTAVLDMPAPDFEMTEIERPTSGHIGIICAKGDMTGNGVPDLILSTDPGSDVYIYRNERGKAPKEACGLGTPLNFTLYLSGGCNPGRGPGGEWRLAARSSSVCHVWRREQ